MKKIALLSLLLTTLFASPAAADQGWIYGHVKGVASDVYPSTLAFVLDVGYSGCGNGNYVFFNHSNPDTMKAVYAALLEAHATGKMTAVYFTSGCNASAVRPWY